IAPGTGAVGAHTAGTLEINAAALDNTGGSVAFIFNGAADHDVLVFNSAVTGTTALVTGAAGGVSIDGAGVVNGAEIDMGALIQSTAAGTLVLATRNLAFGGSPDDPTLAGRYTAADNTLRIRRDIGLLPGLRDALFASGFTEALNKINDGVGTGAAPADELLWRALTATGAGETPDAARLVTALSPAALASLTALPLEHARAASAALRDRLDARRATASAQAAPGNEAYLHFTAGWLDNKHGLHAPVFDLETTALTLGGHRAFGEKHNRLAGLALALHTGDADFHDAAGRARQTSTRLTAYLATCIQKTDATGAGGAPKFFADLALSAGFSDYDTTRLARGGAGFDAAATAATRGNDLAAALRAGFEDRLNDAWGWDLWVALDYARARVRGFDERGAGDAGTDAALAAALGAGAALRVASFSQDSLLLRAGATLRWTPAIAGKRPLRLALRAVCDGEWLDDGETARISARFLTGAGDDFRVDAAAQPSLLRLQIGPAAEFALNARTALFASCTYETAARRAHRAAAGISARW
ncbi:MAG: autotransporter outer membrane beta-barrel domain-containing protein, partial [Opitutaceae bacterium]|nr:autotransporter outer membrane beta-barrel domain-containing protein [Opitutaceae bacterium]